MPGIDYALNYMRLDGKEAKVFPFSSEEDAKEAKKLMESLGATCKGVYPIKRNHQLLELDDYFFYMDIKKFENYLKLELAILECAPSSVAYDFIGELTVRAERFIRAMTPSTSEENDPDHQADLSDRKKEYLHRTAWLIEEKSGFYLPSMGSFPESIGEALSALALLFRKEYQQLQSQ